MPNYRKGLGYWYQVAMIINAPSSAPLEPKGESGKDNQTGEDNVVVGPVQAPSAFEEGGQATQDELQEINLGSDQES